MVSLTSKRQSQPQNLAQGKIEGAGNARCALLGLWRRLFVTNQPTMYGSEKKRRGPHENQGPEGIAAAPLPGSRPRWPRRPGSRGGRRPPSCGLPTRRPPSSPPRTSAPRSERNSKLFFFETGGSPATPPAPWCRARPGDSIMVRGSAAIDN